MSSVLQVGVLRASAAIYVSNDDACKLCQAGNKAYRLTSHGLDCVEFLLAAGPAEPLQPLSAVASGGESARLMLALKAAPVAVMERLGALHTAGADNLRQGSSVSPQDVDAASHSLHASNIMSHEQLLMQQQPKTGSTWHTASANQASGSEQVQPAAAAATATTNTPHSLPSVLSSSSVTAGAPVMILDELDSGVGSRLGGSVGRLLQRMAAPPAPAANQILCVTHLPQVGGG